MSAGARPVGGPILNREFKWLIGFFTVAVVFLGWRFLAGLGATTGLNDGFPWGIWIAYDVVVGTALACGGYAVALLCYVLNRGQYHPLVRPAILTSALGYSLAALSVVIDVGRYWALPKVIFFPWLDWSLAFDFPKERALLPPDCIWRMKKIHMPMIRSMGAQEIRVSRKGLSLGFLTVISILLA